MVYGKEAARPESEKMNKIKKQSSSRYVLKAGFDVAYLALPEHPGSGVCGCVKKTIRLLDLIQDYKGPDLHLDFDEAGVLIGIEFLE